MEFVTLCAADGAQARVSLHGAQVCSWIPAQGQEQLYLSSRATFAQDMAIRGGIPVIFPQFADQGPLPKHGFARTALWRCIDTQHDTEGRAAAVFELRESIARLSLWPHVFCARLHVRVGGDTLSLGFSVENTGDTPFQFTAALHSYFAVTALEEARVWGLGGAAYLDKCRQGGASRQEAALLAIEGETDRIYPQAPSHLEIRQPRQTLVLHSTGLPDAVLWNPGPEAERRLPDVGPGEFRHLLCLEAARIMEPMTLSPGQSWMATHTLRVDPA